MERKRLTDMAVQKMSTPLKGRVEIFDDIVPKLAIRITENGHRSWIYIYRFNGKPKRYTIGNYPTIKVAEAREAARTAEQQVGKGEDPGYIKREKIELQKTYTFAKVFKDYIEKYAKHNQRRWEATERIIEAHALPIWRDMPIEQVKKRDVIALLEKLQKNHKPYTSRNLFAALRAMFNWAASRNLVEISPCYQLEPPIKATQRDRVLTDAEITLLWQVCDLEGYPFGKIVQMLLLTGQRRDEVAKMRWDEVDMDVKVWRIPRERVKADRSHEVPLSSETVALLQGLPRFAVDKGDDGDHYVFSTTGGRKAFGGFSKCKKRTDVRSEIKKPWRIHDLRRTAATNMAKLGVPVYTISQVLNHAQGGVTSIYNRHTYLPEKREALDKWAKRLGEIANNGQTQEK